MTFKKDDSKKVDPTLVPMKQIMKIAEVLDYGAKKYDRDNWQKATPEDQVRYRAALTRHLFAYLDGEEIDPESGLSHLAHVATNTVFLMYFAEKGDLVDVEIDLEDQTLVDLAIKSVDTGKDVNTLIVDILTKYIEAEGQVGEQLELFKNNGE